MNKKGGILATLVLLSVLFSTLSECKDSLSKRQASVTAVSIQPGERIRAIQLNWWPTLNPRVLQLKAVEASQSTGLSQVSAVEFVLSNFQQVALAFGFYAAVAQVPTVQNPNATQGVAQAAFYAAARMFLVFEYVDGNGIEGYQQNSLDNITGFYDLSHKDLQWKPMDFAESSITDSDNNVFKVHTITMETLDEVFLLRVVSTERPVTVNGVRVNPDSMKVDFAVKWFNNPLHVAANWTTGPSAADAHVAVLAVAAAKGGASVAQVGGQSPALHFGAGAFVGFFSWQPTADVTVQGVTAAAAVAAHVVDTSSDPNIQAAFAVGWIIRVVVFSFNATRPDEVFWDPSFGATVDYQQLATQNTQTSASTGGQSGTTSSTADQDASGVSLIASISLVFVALAALLL